MSALAARSLPNRKRGPLLVGALACGTLFVGQFMVGKPTAAQTSNTPPTITAVAPVSLKQGETKTVTLARVTDKESPTTALVVNLVRVVSGPTVPDRPSLIGIPSPNADGTVTGTIQGLCTTTAGTYVYELEVSDGLLKGTQTALLTVNVAPSFVVTAVSPIKLKKVIRADFHRNDTDTAPLGVQEVPGCRNVSFLFERDDSRYAKRLNDRNDRQFYFVEEQGNAYSVRFSPFIPTRITDRPDAEDVLPDNVKTILTLLGPDNKPLLGTSPIVIQAKIAKDVRLFDTASLRQTPDGLQIVYQVWDSDLNSANYVLTYTFYDGSGNQVGPSFTTETAHLQTEINRAVSQRRLLRGQSFLVIQNFASLKLGGVASVDIQLSDGAGNPRVQAVQGRARKPEHATEPDLFQLVDEGAPTVALPPCHVILD